MTLDLGTYQEQSLATWERMAPGWEDRREWLMDITGRANDWLVERADPQPGQTVLDLAAGPGDLGFAIAKRVGPEGRVISTDFAPEMVRLARRLGEGERLGNVDYRVLDAQRMDLAEDSVDAVVCRFGYMLMADPGAALEETRRVLRAGGPLAFAVWTTPDRNPWAAVPGMTLIQRGHMPPPEPGTPGIFAMGEPARIRQLVTGAGFGEPEIEEIPIRFRWSDFDDLWDSLVRVTGQLAQAILALPDEERARTRAAIVESFAPFRADDGSYSAAGMAWGVLAR